SGPCGRSGHLTMWAAPWRRCAMLPSRQSARHSPALSGALFVGGMNRSAITTGLGNGHGSCAIIAVGRLYGAWVIRPRGYGCQERIAQGWTNRRTKITQPAVDRNGPGTIFMAMTDEWAGNHSASGGTTSRSRTAEPSTSDHSVHAAESAAHGRRNAD